MNTPPTLAYLHGDVTSEINAAAITVHKDIGPGFLESIYDEALCLEFERRRISHQRQKPIRVRYQGVPVGLYRFETSCAGCTATATKCPNRFLIWMAAA